MMTQPPTLVRRIYEAVALFSLLNFVGVLFLIGFSLVTGSLTQARLRDAVFALRGQRASPKLVTLDAGRPAPMKATRIERLPAESDEEIEIEYRESERIKTELRQRLALSNSILLKVQQEREAFQREQAEIKRQQEATVAIQRQEGFQRQVAILQALSPKAALQHLLATADADEAARLLTAMDTMRAKKIIEAAKGPNEIAQMKSIVQRLRDAVPIRVVEVAER